MIVLASLVFFTIVLLVGAAFLFVSPNRTQQRLHGMAAPRPSADWTETFAKVAGPFARLSTPDGDWESSPLRIRFLNAGIRRADARLIYFGAKGLVPLVFAMAVFFGSRAFNQTLGLG